MEKNKSNKNYSAYPKNENRLDSNIVWGGVSEGNYSESDETKTKCTTQMKYAEKDFNVVRNDVGDGIITYNTDRCDEKWGVESLPYSFIDIEKMVNKDIAVDHPNHYNSGKIEVIDFIEDQNLGFHLGNAIKYICRAGKKDKSKTKEDLEKAIWYINRYKESLK